MRRLAKPASALLAATLLATLLATAATTLIAYTNNARNSAADSLHMRQARLDAQALIETAIVQLDRSDSKIRADGPPLQMDAMPVGATVRVQDAAGLLDLNATQPPRLAAFFRALAMPAARADALADSIADWRDPDDDRRAHGAELVEYQARHFPGPSNAPFITEEQLSEVLGVSPDLARCLTPYFTVFSGSDFVDASIAPAPVRGAISALGGDIANAATGIPIGHVLIISASAPLSTTAAFRITEWVRLTGDSRRPIMVHRMRTDFTPRDEGSTAKDCTPIFTADTPA